MKNKISLIIVLLIFNIGFLLSQEGNPMIEYRFTNPANNQLGIAAVFNQSTSQNVTLDNAAVNILVPTGYHSPSLTNGWEMVVFVEEPTLTSYCGPSATGYTFYQFFKFNNQNLGSVTAFVPEPLFVITFEGSSSDPVDGLTFPLVGDLHNCLFDLGITNTSSIQWGPNPTPFVGKSDISITPQNISLPIRLLTFTAKKLDERIVKLSWTTSLEINSDYFVIERSKDGRVWTEIGTVEAAGNSHTLRAYDYIDSALPTMSRVRENTLYYKLRMVDQDRGFAYSDIRGVHLNKADLEYSIPIYPNPGLQLFHIDLSNTDVSKGDLDLQVYDMMGKRIIGKKISGGGIELLDMNDYPSGLYQVKITQGNRLSQSRISKI